MLSRKERHRQGIGRQPFPPTWWTILRDAVALVRRLPTEDHDELRGHIQILLAEKHFEGAADLAITDAMRLVIAAQAAVMLLHRPTDYYPRLVSVILYPGEYAVQEEITTEDGLVEQLDETRVGESWQTGTLVLSWDQIEQGSANEAQNVVLHEFAHQLDAESGEMNGAPILPNRRLRHRWADAMSSAFDRLIEADERGEETLLDPYGTEDPAEFFAVATEAFFLIPSELESAEPDLYAVLRDYYCQDPARW